MFAFDHYRGQDVQVQITGVEVSDRGRLISEHVRYDFPGWIELAVRAGHGDQLAVRFGPGLDDANFTQLRFAG